MQFDVKSRSVIISGLDPHTEYLFHVRGYAVSDTQVGLMSNITAVMTREDGKLTFSDCRHYSLALRCYLYSSFSATELVCGHLLYWRQFLGRTKHDLERAKLQKWEINRLPYHGNKDTMESIRSDSSVRYRQFP